MLLGLVAWIVLFGLYLLFAGQVDATEVAAGIPASAAIACFTGLLHRQAARRFSLGGPWPRILGQPLAALVPDAVRVGRVLLRTLPRRPPGALGVIARQPFRQGGDEPSAAARRGLVTLGSSFAPNGYVLAIPSGEEALVLHRLAPVPADPDRDWPL